MLTQDTRIQISSQGFSFGWVGFNAGMDMSLKGGFARKQKFFTDPCEFVAGSNRLGKFDCMFFAL
jgi:hypothetical protein